MTDEELLQIIKQTVKEKRSVLDLSHKNLKTLPREIGQLTSLGGRERMNYKYTMVIQWSEADQLYLVHLPEFPWQQFVTHGKTYQEAAQNGQEALEGLIEVLRANSQPLPEPHQIEFSQVA